MSIEIERKYLVDKVKWSAMDKGDGALYQQGYIVHEAGKTVRVRVTPDSGYLTIKGPSSGASREEFEYLIPIVDADALLQRFCTIVIKKVRYRVKHDGKVWEVDEFRGANEGLIVAEIELTSEEELFALPDWVTKEVTGDKRYYNAALISHPYSIWRNQ